MRVAPINWAALNYDLERHLAAANVPDSFNARTCSLSSGGRDKFPSAPAPEARLPTRSSARLRDSALSGGAH